MTRIIYKAKVRIVLVDNYVDVGTLNILSKKQHDVRITIYTSKQTRISEYDIKIFNQQYPTLEVNYTGVFNDKGIIHDIMQRLSIESEENAQK